MRRVGLRSRWTRWRVTLAAVGVIIVGGAAAVAKWPHAWWWLVVVMAAVVAAAPPAVAALSQAWRRHQEIGQLVRAGLQGTTGKAGSKLPAAATADLEARVHQTVLAIPYIHRDDEDTIRVHLRAGHPVLLIGSSMVGKTRMAARIIIEEFGSWQVAIPVSKTALADLDAQDVTLRRSVIWLDDIDRLIGGGGITDEALRRLAAAGNIIVGTIRARAYDQLRPSDQQRLPEWDVLGVFEHVFVSRDLTQNEQERLASAVDDPGIRDRIRAVGLGEYVGAAGQVAEALKLGAAGTDSLGYALVLAAADWRRCGMTRPIPASILASLAKPHLDPRGQARLTDQDAVDTGLAWATRDINSNVSLLQLDGTDSYVVYDYALDLISAQDTPIPDSNWSVIMSNADPPELVNLGYAAHVTYHRSEIAIEAWRKAASSRHADAAPAATYHLGVLAHLGLGQGAKDAWQEAVDSGHVELEPIPMLNLGELAKSQGDVQGAKDAWQKVIDSGYIHPASEALFRLGDMLKEHGDVRGAKDAWQKAIDSGGYQAPKAAVRLGALLQDQGDVQGVKDAWQKAIDSGDGYQAPMAALRLGALLQDQGDVQGAQEAWQKIIDSGNFSEAPQAAFNLGGLLEYEGDVQGAKYAWQKAIDSGHAKLAPLAAVDLARLLKDHGDTESITEMTLGE